MSAASRRRSRSARSRKERGVVSPDGAEGAPSSSSSICLAPGGPGANALDAKVLVLNKLYMAIRVIPARRAFVLLFKDLAEVIHVDNGQWTNFDFESWSELSAMRDRFDQNYEWVSTVRFEIAVPKVIRLLGYDRLPAQHVKLNRRNLFARDRNQCQYCGKTFPTSELSIDHVTPRSQGGGDTWHNLVCACVSCNARKGGRTPTQAGIKLIRKPVQPKRNPLISARLGHARTSLRAHFVHDAMPAESTPHRIARGDLAHLAATWRRRALDVRDQTRSSPSRAHLRKCISRRDSERPHQRHHRPRHSS